MERKHTLAPYPFAQLWPSNLEVGSDDDQHESYTSGSQGWCIDKVSMQLYISLPSG
jgi:hypothetical protein